MSPRLKQEKVSRCCAAPVDRHTVSGKVLLVCQDCGEKCDTALIEREAQNG